MRRNESKNDEELAKLIDNGVGRSDIIFEDFDSYEAYGVASHALGLIQEDELFEGDIFGGEEPGFELGGSLSMCAFLGDEDDIMEEEEAQIDDPTPKL